MEHRNSFAGIGSRSQPYSLMLIMMRLSAVLMDKGWRLTSGGAQGADNAFEIGARLYFQYKDATPAVIHDQLRIYLPWNGFEGRQEGMPGVLVPSRFETWPEAVKIANEFHPSLKTLSGAVEKFMGRNGYQVLQDELNQPVDMLVCSTQDQCIDGTRTSHKTGGTGQALRLASHHKVPVRNLQHQPHLEKVVQFLYDNKDIWLPLNNALQDEAKAKATIPDTDAGTRFVLACSTGELNPKGPELTF